MFHWIHLNKVSEHKVLAFFRRIINYNKTSVTVHKMHRINTYINRKSSNHKQLFCVWKIQVLFVFHKTYIKTENQSLMTYMHI